VVVIADKRTDFDFLLQFHSLVKTTEKLTTTPKKPSKTLSMEDDFSSAEDVVSGDDSVVVLVSFSKICAIPDSVILLYFYILT
jgi:hypothetical protein